MKRTIISLVAVLLTAQSLFATLGSVDWRGIQLTAQKGEVQEVSLNPIAAASLDSSTGMPFDIESDNVAFSAVPGAVTGKRMIATWSMYCNFPDPVVETEAGHLRHTDGTEVPYSLAFYYQFPMNDQMLDGNLIVQSGVAYNSKDDLTCKWNGLGVGVSFTERPVRLMLSDVNVSGDEYPAGSYRADVTVRVSAK